MSIKYACTALVGTNKTGNLKPDENGYYRLVLGALDFYSSSGIYYDYQSSRHVFENSSSFMRRISNGNLYSEQDHPEWIKGWSLEEYMARVKKINMTNCVAHIRDVEVIHEKDTKTGKMAYVIYGSVKPSGEKGALLKEALENPHQNVCFSLRSLCNDRMVGGRYTRSLSDLITFDWVIENGLSNAHKFNAPGLESFSAKPIVEMDVPVETIESLVANAAKHQSGVGVALESHAVDDLKAVLHREYGNRQKIIKPSALSW